MEASGYECPSDQCDVVYPNPVAAFHHYYKTNNNAHRGDVESVDLIKDMKTDRDPNRGVLLDTVSESAGVEIPVVKESVKELGVDPTFLTSYQLNNLEMVDLIDHILPLLGNMIAEIERIENKMARGNHEMASILASTEQSQRATEPPTQHKDRSQKDEPSPETEDEAPTPTKPPNNSGSSKSDDEIREAEEEQVKTVLQRGDLLGDDELDMFMTVYKERGSSISKSEIDNRSTLPSVVFEDVLDDLVDQGLIKENNQGEWEYVY